MLYPICSDEQTLASCSDYKGFVAIDPIDRRAPAVQHVDPETLQLAYPRSVLLNSQRRALTKRGVMLGISIADVFDRYPSTVPPSCLARVSGEPVRIMTSTRMRSTLDNRIYIAYFYFDNKLVRSFVAQKPWASRCPSLLIPAR